MPRENPWGARARRPLLAKLANRGAPRLKKKTDSQHTIRGGKLQGWVPTAQRAVRDTPRDPRPKTGQGRLSSRGHRRGPKGRDGGRPRLPAPLPHSRPEPLVVRRMGRDLPQLWRPPTKIPPENEKQSGAAAAVPRQNFIKTHPRPKGVNTPEWLVIHRRGATLPSDGN